MIVNTRMKSSSYASNCYLIFYEKRTDMELCQGDNTPSPKQTNQEHTSRGRHKVFNKVENPHHAASPK